MRLAIALIALAACSSATKGTLPSSSTEDDTDDVTTSDTLTTDGTGDDDDDDDDDGSTGVDADGDGWAEDSDCDDDDPNTYPGAEEICDGEDNDCDGEVPEEEFDNDEDGVRECDEECAPPAQATINLLPVCEYTPSAAGAFEPKIEWALTHRIVDLDGTVFPSHTWAEFDGYGSVYQSPVVSQATDDNFDGVVDDDDMPDIAAVMAYYDLDHLEGVLRLISGDGDVKDSIHWESWTNANGTDDYAPYRYAGVAMGDVDLDGDVEIVTTVVGQATGLCWPAVYEVSQAGANISLNLEMVYSGSAYSCGGHAAALADLDDDGDIEIVYGRAVFDGALNLQWYGNDGRGWYGREDYPYPEGYWNSGYHSFAYDMDGDGRFMEVVAGRTVYEHDGDVFCELGEYVGNTWVPALDGYPAVGDVVGFPGDGGGEPEIVVTGNEKVSIYHGSPRYDTNGLKRCVLIDEVPNAPWSDPAVSGQLPYHPNCDDTRKSFGGPPTIADFDGNGTKEFAVAGSCYYTVFKMGNQGVERYAMAQTKDFSSASTGSTVFDFNGDGASEIVFSDEDAVYVWGLNDAPNLDPWERLDAYLVDNQHKSWTIHEYPLVADVDSDGKAEILVANSYLPGFEDHFGLYVLGAADDDWVSARTQWNQHAYFVTNVEDDGYVGYGAPNYSPYTVEDYNSFRLQAPGAFGALAAPNAEPVTSSCQDGCGDAAFWIQVGNSGDFISVSPDIVVALYGVNGNQRTLLDYRRLNEYVDPGQVSTAVEFNLPASEWSLYDHLVAVVDDPAATAASSHGHAKECDETDNEQIIELTGLCP